MDVTYRRLLVAGSIGVALYILFFYLADVKIMIPMVYATDVPILGPMEGPMDLTIQPFYSLGQYGLWIAACVAVVIFVFLRYRKRMAELL